MDEDVLAHPGETRADAANDLGSDLLPELSGAAVGANSLATSVNVNLPRTDVLIEYEADHDALSSGGESPQAEFINEFIADTKGDEPEELSATNDNDKNLTDRDETDGNDNHEVLNDEVKNTEEEIASNVESKEKETDQLAQDTEIPANFSDKQQTSTHPLTEKIIAEGLSDPSIILDTNLTSDSDPVDIATQEAIQHQEDAAEDSRFEKDLATAINNKSSADVGGADDDDDDFDDDDFDDFNEFQGSTDFETTEYETVTMPVAYDTTGVFPESLFHDLDAYRAKLDEVLAPVFDNLAVVDSVISREASSLLDDRSHQVSEEIARLPRLKPPNWKRLNIRHNLLINLGIPINLDETTDTSAGGLFMVKNRPPVHKVDWKGLPVPSFEALNLDQAAADEILARSAATLSRIDVDNLTNSTAQFLESQPESVIDAKLELFKNNYTELLTLASVWQHQLEEQTKNTEIYGEVVQSMIGYSHKKQREEIMEEKRRK